MPIDPRHATSDRPRAHWSLYLLVGGLTCALLVYGAAEQIFDTNFYALWEATALLAGDNPYRDFYQWGSPMLTALSTVVQWVAGNRLIGEFVIQWSFIIAGVVMGFHLALRLSRSVAASLIATLIAILIVAATPIFHYPKIFFYPLAVWFAWWYMERPSVRRAATLGLVTTLAFLYRHDHGVYIGLASILTFALARVAVPASRTLRRAAGEAGAYVAVAVVVVMPWAIVVQTQEGLVDYVRTRGEWAQMWAPSEFPYLRLRDISPVRSLAADDQEAGDAGRQERVRWPSREHAQHWLFQVTLLLPIFVLVSAGLDVLARRRRNEPVSLETCQTILAAGLVAIVAIRLFREDGYFVVVLPLTAAFASRLLAAPDRDIRRGVVPGVPEWIRRAWRVTERTLAFGLLLVTGAAALGFAHQWGLLALSEAEELPSAFRQLVSSPPIDAYQPADAARQFDRAAWTASDADTKQKVMIRYMHDCTREGDRVLVTGSTPYQVGYYVERPIAGGHLFWHHRWRSDPVHETQSLMLLEHQSVPFAFSTHDPVLDDLKAYPRIHEYMTNNYVELPGSNRLLLVDTRRQPTGAFGTLGFPCFR